jgi:lactate dehydrogenase-like 2-hydroxyacid dehydrogenase
MTEPTRNATARPVVLVPEGVHARGKRVFGHEHELDVQVVGDDEQALAEAVRRFGCRAAVVGGRPYLGPLYEALGEAGGSDGAVLARFGVGHDGIDKPLCRQHGILVTNTPGTLDVSVAEFTIALMLSVLRRIVRVAAPGRPGAGVAPSEGVELRGRTLGLIGFGGIARRVAAAASFGLGMRVLAAGRRSADQLRQDESVPLAHLCARFGLEEYTDDADSVLARADVVSLHVPATPETDGLMGAGRLERMKQAAVLINTARGSVVDESALFDALASGRLGGAGLDVSAVEPYEPARIDKDLRTLDNVVLTPHVASDTVEANDRMAAASLENVRCFFAGAIDRMSRVD